MVDAIEFIVILLLGLVVERDFDNERLLVNLLYIILSYSFAKSSTFLS